MQKRVRATAGNSDSGGTMVEYAICFPIFIGVILALLYILRWFYTTAVLQYTSYDVGRMLSQSEILAVPEVDYCGNAASLYNLSQECVTLHNNLREASERADTLLRTMLGGGAYRELKTYTLYDPETYRQYGYTIPAGFPAIQSKLLFLRPGEVVKDNQGNIITHPNRPPGPKVTDRSQCMNRAEGWPSPLCGNQKMKDVMQDKAYIVSAQVNEPYTMPLIGRQVFPAIGTQVFYAAGGEAVKEIPIISTETPTQTPTNTPTPTNPPTSTPTEMPTYTPTPFDPPPPPQDPPPVAPPPMEPPPPSPDEGPLLWPPSGGGGGGPSPCVLIQNWTSHWALETTHERPGGCPKYSCSSKWVCGTVDNCYQREGPPDCSAFNQPAYEVSCSASGGACVCCDRGFTENGRYYPPACSFTDGPKGYETVCVKKEVCGWDPNQLVCETVYEPCLYTVWDTMDMHHCSSGGAPPALSSPGGGWQLMALSPVWWPMHSCGCSDPRPCTARCVGIYAGSECKYDADCRSAMCAGPLCNRPGCSTVPRCSDNWGYCAGTCG